MLSSVPPPSLWLHFSPFWPSSLPTRSSTETKAESGIRQTVLYRPLAGLPARIFLCSAMAPRINQHCRFSVINIPFYVTIIYHFPLQAYDLSVCFYRQRPGPFSASREVFSLFHNKDTCLETETHPWPQNDADFPRGPDDK